MDEEMETSVLKKSEFNFQKENVYNKLLPYAEYLDEESTKLFTDIKTNLVKAVLAREMRPGCALWTSRLNKYIKIYGLKFSKEDHIALIKLFYELIIIPDLEPTRINKCANTLIQLLKKRYLLSRKDLELDWRPLYNLCQRVMEKSHSELGMYRYFSTFENSIFNVVRAARIYFPASSTQEILDEFRPKLCPFNGQKITNAIQYLEIFLPVCVEPEEADISYKLWFDEFMTLWNTCHNASLWENHMTWLLARLSSFNMGHINWQPYISIMFTRFVRALNLPVVFKQKQLGKQHKIDISPIAIWITCALHGDNNTAFYHFEKFMQTLETYFHSANSGRWTSKLRELLKKLSFYFLQRVHSERFRKPTWEKPIPDGYKLTDADIDRFVNIMKPCIEQAMFSRAGQQDTSLTLQYLATLRPNIIIPMTLDKLYASMDSLTEPHKLVSSMMGVMSVGRYMVQGARNNYPEGPTHVVPLLLALLPGIDPNDIKKSYVTFNFIVNFVNMIPLINSSDAHNYHELSEEEHIVCEATANFEDFVLQFIDKLCVWVESCSLDFVRLEIANNSNNNKNRSETLAENIVGSVITAILGQCSPEIFTSALKKFFNFVSDKVLEIHISGKMIAVSCHCFARVNPKETLKLFVPHLCNKLEQVMKENPNIGNEENIDDEFLYNLLLLSELLDGRSELLLYMDRIFPILDKTLHMTCLKASQLAARLLELLMFSLTHIRPVEVGSTPISYSTPVKDYLSIRDWGNAQKLKDLKINWYVPGDSEIKMVKTLLNKYLLPELENLDKHCNGDITLSRQKLKESLKIMNSIMSCHPVLPIWDEPAYQLVESVLDPWAFHLKVGGDYEVSMPDGRNVRKVVADTLHRTQKKILESDEGDTKSLKSLICIYNIILFNKSHGQDFESHWKNFHFTKKMLEDRLHQNKLHLRFVLVDRAVLHQEFRTESRSCTFTETHKQILLDMFELGISRYSDVRVNAQIKISSIVAYFPYSYTVLTPKIMEVLQIDSELNHEAFKGCLYILIGPKSSPIVARHDWQFIRKMWPLIVTSKPSEKVSVVNLITALSESVHRYFPTIAIKLLIPESTLDAVQVFAKSVPVIDTEKYKYIIENSEESLKQKSEIRRVAYNETLDALLDACEHGNLHWRYHVLALGFLKDLVHFDVNYNSRLVRYILKCSISESLTIRKAAIKILVYITIQNKPKFKKIEVDPFSFSEGSGNRNNTKVIPGYRDDNAWLLYDSKLLPKNSEEWDQPRFLHNMYIGYYAWPQKLEVYAPYAEQPSVAKRMDNMSDTENEIYMFFSNKDNVDQLIKYLSLEEKKGSDQFNVHRFLVFKNLFKMFEDKLLDIFVEHIEKLVEDKQESSHRCAAEIIAGVIRGSKHWSYEKCQNLWSKFIPIFETVFTNMCNEALFDWSLCVTMALDSRDSRRHYWFFEYLLDDPLKGQTAFVGSSRLSVLYLALSHQSWRNVELKERLLAYLQSYLSHPFQNIRERISMVLTVIFSTDLQFPGANEPKGSRISTFFDTIRPKLNQLYSYMLSKVDINDKNEIDQTCDTLNAISITTDDEKESATRLYKIVAKYSAQSAIRMNYSTLPEYFELVPLASILQGNDIDEELSTLCVNILVVMAQSMTIEKYIPDALNAIKKVARSPFWTARAVIAELLSVFVFYNMATIHANNAWRLEIQTIVLELMEDVKPEVRINAAQVLSGLLHCQFLEQPMELLKIFTNKARTKLKSGSNKEVSNLRIRHAGVLGLCAFISSHPYDVPEYLPSIFGKLGPHLSDPQPIPSTIRKTLGDFKRTHYDNWEFHKLKFTEDELSVLSDLTVPPSYYA